MKVFLKCILQDVANLTLNKTYIGKKPKHNLYRDCWVIHDDIGKERIINKCRFENITRKLKLNKLI